MLKPCIAVLCACTLSPFASARAKQATPEPINDACPIGKEPIAPSAGTVKHNGHIIGFCCPGCAGAFNAWDDARKDDFISRAIAQDASKKDGAPAADAAIPAAGGVPGPSYAYTLPDCPVGGPLGSMGQPVVKVYDNREVRFCCAGCVGAFEADKAAYWNEIDEKIVEQQRMHYPISTCIVTGGKLAGNAINHVHNNRLVRLANAEALEAFNADPAGHLEALDEKIIDAQLLGYPMDTCPVGGPLGSMGEPVNFISMNRLVRLCCAGCEGALVNEPAEYMGKLDAAYAARQRDGYALETCVVSGSPLGSMGDPVELVAGDTLVRFCCAGCIPTFKEDPSAYLSKLSKK